MFKIAVCPDLCGHVTAKIKTNVKIKKKLDKVFLLLTLQLSFTEIATLKQAT